MDLQFIMVPEAPPPPPTAPYSHVVRAGDFAANASETCAVAGRLMPPTTAAATVDMSASMYRCDLSMTPLPHTSWFWRLNGPSRDTVGQYAVSRSDGETSHRSALNCRQF